VATMAPAAVGRTVTSNSLLGAFQLGAGGNVWALPASYFGTSESWQPVDELSWVPSWLTTWLRSLALWAMWYAVTGWILTACREQLDMWTQTVQVSLPTGGVPLVGAAVGAGTVGLAIAVAFAALSAIVAGVIGETAAQLASHTIPAWPAPIAAIVEVLNYLVGFMTLCGFAITGVGVAQGVRLAGLVARLVRTHLPTTGAIALGFWLSSGDAAAGSIRFLVPTTNAAVTGGLAYWPLARVSWTSTNGVIQSRNMTFTAPGEYELQNWDRVVLMGGVDWNNATNISLPTVTNRSSLQFEAVWIPQGTVTWAVSSRYSPAYWASTGFGVGVGVALAMWSARWYYTGPGLACAWRKTTTQFSAGPTADTWSPHADPVPPSPSSRHTPDSER